MLLTQTKFDINSFCTFAFKCFWHLRNEFLLNLFLYATHCLPVLTVLFFGKAKSLSFSAVSFKITLFSERASNIFWNECTNNCGKYDAIPITFFCTICLRRICCHFFTVRFSMRCKFVSMTLKTGQSDCY